MEIRVTLRNGAIHTLDFADDARMMFERLTSEPISDVYPLGWLPVRSTARTVVSAAEVVSLRLVDPDESHVPNVSNP